MKPTTIGSAPRTVTADIEQSAGVQLAPLNTGAVVLRTEQVPMARTALSSLDFATMPPADVIKLGFDAEQALQRTLDGFLDRKSVV